MNDLELLDAEGKAKLLSADSGEYYVQTGSDSDSLVQLTDLPRIARKKNWDLAAVEVINASDSLSGDSATTADDSNRVVFVNRKTSKIRIIEADQNWSLRGGTSTTYKKNSDAYGEIERLFATDFDADGKIQDACASGNSIETEGLISLSVTDSGDYQVKSAAGDCDLITRLPAIAARKKWSIVAAEVVDGVNNVAFLNSKNGSVRQYQADANWAIKPKGRNAKPGTRRFEQFEAAFSQEFDQGSGTDDQIGIVDFPANSVYGDHAMDEAVTLQCQTPAYLDAGSEVSPGYFHGGCPQPATLLGSWGPGSLYIWTDFLTQEDPAPIASAKNVMALPNGIAMIHWDENNLDSSLNDSYSVEMITGWGSYTPKTIPNDYGWINGTIFNMLDRFQVPFLHIYYREVTGTEDGVETGNLHFWEAALTTDEDIENVGLIYDQLKDQIDSHFDAITNNTRYSPSDLPEVPLPLADVIDSVYYMNMPSNGQIPTVASQHWSENTAYPGNNRDLLAAASHADSV